MLTFIAGVFILFYFIKEDSHAFINSIRKIFSIKIDLYSIMS